MKSKFFSALRYLILGLSFLNIIFLVLFEFTGKIFFFSVANHPFLESALQTSINVTLILATLYAYVFQKPKDLEMWFTQVTIWGFNIFTLLFSAGLFDFGNDSWFGVFLALVVITMFVNCLAYFPYDAFQKHEAKSQ